jgi:hypothetical protein
MKNNSLHTPRLSVLCALCAAGFIFAAAGSAFAQDWRFEPIFKVGGEYDDNATLDSRTDQEVDLSGLLLNASANIYYTAPATTFFVQPRVVSRNYNDDSVFDSDDYFLRSDFRRRVKLSTFGFRANVEQQSVRTGEASDSDLEIEDPDDIVDDDTGRTVRFGDRTKLRVTPYWEYQVSKVSSIGAKLDYRDTRYDDVFAGILADYSDTRLDLNYRRSFSDVTDWEIVLTGRRYDSENLAEDIDGYGVSAGIVHRLSEKTQVRARIGFEDTDESGADTDPEVAGFVTLIRNLETIRLLAQYRRSVSSSGAARVSVRDSLNLNFRRRLSEKISAGLGVRAYQSKEVGGSASNEDRDYVQLQSSLTWYLTRSFVIEADYRYTVIDRSEGLGESANSNQVTLWFTYQPKTTPKI